MNAQDLTLNIAVNLGRVSRWAIEGKTFRIQRFLEDTEIYLKELDQAQKSPKFINTYNSFKKKFNSLKDNKKYDAVWAEDALTWANILTHRAKLA